MNDLLEWIKRLSVRHDIPVFGIARSSHLENDTPGSQIHKKHATDQHGESQG